MMRWRMAWAIPWLLAAALPVLLTQGSTAQDDNLLVNGGFEDGTAGWLAIGGELTTSDALVRQGSYAGLFVTASTSSRREISQCLPVAPSSDYEFGGYAARRQGDALSSLRLRVLWRDQENCLGQTLWSPDSPIVMLDEEEHWYELALGGRSPSAARSAYLTIAVEESGATVYLDDFVGSGPAAPTETPTLEPSPEPSPSASPTPTPEPDLTSTPTATAQPRTPSPSVTARPSPSATPRISPTASSWQMTPVPPTDELRNGGFEDAGPEGLPAFWRKWGGELARTSTVRFEGQFAASFSSRTRVTKWAYQIVTVQGGRAYVLSAYALKDDPTVVSAYLRLSWYASQDGSGQAIDSADSSERLTDDSPEFRFLTTEAVVAPAEAASAKARLMLDPVGEAPGTVYFDAVTFEETTPPEPTLSPTATPPPADDEETPTPASPTLSDSASAPTSEPRTVPSPSSSATRPRSSPPAVGVVGNRTPTALGATRTPVAAATSTRVPAAVYRQRKSDLSAGERAAARQESIGGGLSPQLLGLATAVPALVAVGAGAYYWRWRRARLR